MNKGAKIVLGLCMSSVLLVGCSGDNGETPSKYELTKEQKAYNTDVKSSLKDESKTYKATIEGYQAESKALGKALKRAKTTDEKDALKVKRGELLSKVRAYAYDYTPTKKDVEIYLAELNVKLIENKLGKVSKEDKLDLYVKALAVHRYYTYDYSTSDKKKEDVWYAGKYGYEFASMMRDSYLWDKNVAKTDKERYKYIEELQKEYKTKNLN